MWPKPASNDFVSTCFFHLSLVLNDHLLEYKYVTTINTMLKWAHYGECWVSDSCCVPAGRGWPPLVCVGSPVGLFPPSPGGYCSAWLWSITPTSSCLRRLATSSSSCLLLRSSCSWLRPRLFTDDIFSFSCLFTSSSREQRDASRSYWDCSSSTCTRGRWQQEEIKRLYQVCLL